MIRRLFVGGLGFNISETELQQRFSAHLDVKNVEMINARDGTFRGMAYVDVEADDGKIKSFMRVYNGSKWKGGNLRVEDAKESSLKRYESERNVDRVDVIEKKRKWRAVEFDEDMNQITPRNCKNRKYWKRLPTGKPVRIMRMKLSRFGRVSVIDPAKFISSFKKFRFDQPDEPEQINQCPSLSLPYGRLEAGEEEEMSDTEEANKLASIRAEVEESMLKEEKQKALNILSQLLGPNDKKDNVFNKESLEKENLFMKDLFYGENKNQFSFGFVAEPITNQELVKTASNEVMDDVFLREKHANTLQFFFHDGNSNNSAYKIFDNLKYTFKRRTKEINVEFWESVKDDLTLEYKKRLKNTTRLSNKLESNRN